MARCVALLWLGLLMMVGAPAFATSPWQTLADPMFVHADTRELPEAAVMALAQDSAGFLWVGTQGGLARFDGYHYRSFLPNAGDPQALPDGYIRTLLADPNGGLWIGSSSNGLVHFDPATETFHTWRRDPAGRTGPRSAEVDALADAGDGRLWVGGDGGLGRFDPRTGTNVAQALSGRGTQPIVWSVFVDRRGAVWAGTQTGLYERPAGASRFHAVALAADAPPVYSVAQDQAGRIWAGATNAVYVLDAGGRVTRALVSAGASGPAPGQQWSIAELQPGVMWVGTDDAISLIDARTFAVHRVETDAKNAGGLTAGRVLQFLRDRSGMVWLADHIGGLLLFDPFSRGLYEISGSRADINFSNEGMPALDAVAPDRLWVGGFNGRLAELHPPSRHLAFTDLPNRAAIQTLATGSGGRLWIGSTNGLCRLDPGASAPVCPREPGALAAPSVYAILEFAGRLWVGGSTGLLVENLADGTVAPYRPRDGGGLTNSQVRVLYRDRRHRLWVGTENGLDRIDPGGRMVRFVFASGDPDSIGPGGMTTILEDRRGRIWAGAAGGPLDVLQDEPGGKTRIHRIGLADGMPHENVDGLAEDTGGRIWASTDRGLATIDPDSLHARAVGLADGVSEGAFWAGASQSSDGTMFFGGLEGITVVAPGASSPWTYAPPLVVSELRVGRRSVAAWNINRGNATVDLPADARDISVEFSALDYSAPRALRYQYKLDRYDRDWIDVDAQHRVASYSHLAPGNYTLEVRGTNRLGIWSRYVLRLGVHALPAWYETRWFRLLLLALLMLAAYAAHRLRTTVLRQRQHELEAIVERRTRELSEANAKLQELSLSDPLTGLRNRRFLTQHLEVEISRTVRRYENWRAHPTGPAPEDSDVLFFLVDLDHFKFVNDRFGHHAGDMLLVQMRERLQEVFRESDFVVRWGGDEFLTVTRENPRDEGGPIAERIREAVASRPFRLDGGQTIEASVSVGFAAFPFVQSAPEAVSWLQVVAIADRALYMAKEAGRDTWFGLTATEQTDPRRLAQLDLASDDLVAGGALRVLSRTANAYGTADALG